MNLYELLEKPTELIDTHCHLNAGVYDVDRDQILKNAQKNGVAQTWDISTDRKSSKKSIELSNIYQDVHSFIGIDPEILIPGSDLYIGGNEVIDSSWFAEQSRFLDDLILRNRDAVVGIGESGLDHYWLSRSELPEAEVQRSKELQDQLFMVHIELAAKHHLPLSIHSRGAEQACLEKIAEFPVTGIFHSYTGEYKTASKILDQGWGLGVNGIVTFKNAHELRAVYKKLLGKISLDWSPADFYKKGIYFETDGPFLSPEGKRGERNEPRNVSIIFDYFVSSLRET